MRIKWILSVFFILIVVQPLEPFGAISITIFSMIELILLVLIWLDLRRKNKEQIDNIAEYREGSNREIIQLMKIYRHDWQNYLQIIFGYVTLKKYDQIPKYIEKINQMTKQQSTIASFYNVNLAAYLFKLPISYPLLSYDIEVDDNVTILTKHNKRDDHLYEQLKKLIDLMYGAIENNCKHHLVISITAIDNKIVINFEYEGNIDPIYQELLSLGEDSNKIGDQFLIDIHNDQESIIELYIRL